MLAALLHDGSHGFTSGATPLSFTAGMAADPFLPILLFQHAKPILLPDVVGSIAMTNNSSDNDVTSDNFTLAVKKTSFVYTASSHA